MGFLDLFKRKKKVYTYDKCMLDNDGIIKLNKNDRPVCHIGDENNWPDEFAMGQILDWLKNKEDKILVTTAKLRFTVIRESKK